MIDPNIVKCDGFTVHHLTDVMIPNVGEVCML
jgi:hypothetical protein